MIINLSLILCMLVVILIVKLFLDKQNNDYNNINNTNNDMSGFLKDDKFEIEMQKMYLDTQNKINDAVERGYIEGFKSMQNGNGDGNNSSPNIYNNTVVSYINKDNIIKIKLFYKTKCSYSSEFLPVWYKIVNNLPNNVMYEEIECDKQPKLAADNNIISVPTIILTVNNNKKVYIGDRTYKDITRFLRLNGVNLIERTFEKFDSTGYDVDNTDSTDSTKNIDSTKPINMNCPSVTFDKDIDIEADNYMFQIFNDNGQYGYTTGTNKHNDINPLSPFNAAYATVDSYLSSLPDTNNTNECANLYANEIRSFGLCDLEGLDGILNYKTQIQNGSGISKIKNGTLADYDSNDKIVRGIKNACGL